MFHMMKVIVFLTLVVVMTDAAFAFTFNNYCNLFGQETQANPHLLKERVRACEKQAKEGDIDAQIELVRIYVHNGYGWRDLSLAEKWAREAAKSKTAQGYDTLGWLLALKPNRTDEEIREAVQAYMQANKMGVENELRLVQLLEGCSCISDMPKVFAGVKKEADEGNASLQYFLGKAYLEGLGVPQNGDKAIAWYMHLLQQKESYSLYAPYALGLIYEKGKAGVTVDIDKALQFYQIGAQRGDRDSKLKVTKILNRHKPLSILRVPNYDGQEPKWVALLYSDGTLDIQAEYSNGKWKKVDMNQWVKSHFADKDLPRVPLPDFPDGSEMLAIKGLSFKQSDTNTKAQVSWFPRRWVSLKHKKEYVIDRIAQLASECDIWYSLVVQGKQPYDPATSYLDEVEQPKVVDYIASWDVQSISVHRMNYDADTRLKSRTVMDMNKKEEAVFSDLIEKIKKYNPDFLQDRKFSSQHVWKKEDRQKFRQQSQQQVSKVKMLDGSSLFQILIERTYKDSFFHTYYNAWVSENHEQLELLESHMSLADMDWKSISYETPIGAAWVIDKHIYAVGSHYAAGTSNIIYKLSPESREVVFEQYDSRSCE